MYLKSCGHVDEEVEHQALVTAVREWKIDHRYMPGRTVEVQVSWPHIWPAPNEHAKPLQQRAVAGWQQVVADFAAKDWPMALPLPLLLWNADVRGEDDVAIERVDQLVKVVKRLKISTLRTWVEKERLWGRSAE
jgi:hypothetical protein